MPIDLAKLFVVGISSRALFDLEEENSVFDTKGVPVFSKLDTRMHRSILHPQGSPKTGQ